MVDQIVAFTSDLGFQRMRSAAEQSKARLLRVAHSSMVKKVGSLQPRDGAVATMAAAVEVHLNALIRAKRAARHHTCR